MILISCFKRYRTQAFLALIVAVCTLIIPLSGCRRNKTTPESSETGSTKTTVTTNTEPTTSAATSDTTETSSDTDATDTDSSSRNTHATTSATKAPATTVTTKPTDSGGSDEDVPGIYELLDDDLLYGTMGSASNVIMEPLDAEWLKLKNNKKPLQPGESFTQTFDGDYFDNRLRPESMGTGAEYAITDDADQAVNATNSLVINSKTGNYMGIYLKGMRFTASGTYRVEFDYRIVKASNDFFFQFRADSDGTSGTRIGDRFLTISGNDGATGHIDVTMDLGDFPDYFAMIFPRNNSGTIAVDDLKITRINSKPVARDTSLDGSLSVGSALQGSYTYFDAENEAESGTTIRWFTALDKNGLNKMLIDGQTARSLTITGDMNHKYIGFEVTPRSVTAGTQGIGTPAIVWSSNPVGGSNSAAGQDVQLDKQESFTETFEADEGESKNIVFQSNPGVDAYITGNAGVTTGSGKALVINTPGAYTGVRIDNIKFAGLGVYDISFDYRIVNAPDTFYIQLRSDSGGYAHDKFAQVDVSANGTAHFTGRFLLDEYADYYLMMFPSAKGGTIAIDNLRILRQDAQNIQVVDKDLAVGESFTDSFDDIYTRQIGYDNAQTPNSTVTGEEGKAISGSSLYFESAGGYKCLFLKGVTFHEQSVYRVHFRYTVLSRQDLFYFQILSSSGAFSTYAEFGKSDIPLGAVREFDGVFTLNSAETAYLMQIFPGGASGTSSLVIDDFTVERLDPASSVFTNKPLNAGESLTETFENGLFGGNIAAAQQGSGTFSLTGKADEVPSGTGTALKVNVVDPYTGVLFKNGLQYVHGEKYRITFDYKVLTNPSLSAMYIQIGGADYGELNSLTVGKSGQYSVLVTCSSANGNPEILQMFGNQPGLSLAIDNLTIERYQAPPNPNSVKETFDTATPVIGWSANNGGALAKTQTAAELPSSGLGNALKITCPGAYDGVVFTPASNRTMIAGQKYTITFHYKILANPNNSTMYVQLGGGGDYTQIPTSAGYDGQATLTLTCNSNVLQLFGNQAGLVFTMDNVMIEKVAAVLNPSAVTENFDSSSLNIAYNPNGSGQLSVLNDWSLLPRFGSGAGLQVTCPGAYDGVILVPQTALVPGKKYQITFSYRILANPNNSTIYVQLGGGGEYTQIPATAGYDDTATLTLTCNANMLQLFGNQPGLVFVMDDIQIAAVTNPDAITETFDASPVLTGSPNNGGVLSVTATPSELPTGASGHALKVSCPGAFDGAVFIPSVDKALVPGKKYRITFRYKILSNPNNSTLYVQLGGGGDYTQIATALGHDELVTITLTCNANMLQMFGNQTGLVFSLDDFSIEIVEA